MGQDSPLCLFPTDRRHVSSIYSSSPPYLILFISSSISPANGSLWSKPKPRNSPKGQSVPRRCGVKPPQLPSLSHLDLEELPVRLAHRVKELDELPHNLSAMPSIKKVKNWYAQSFEVRQSLNSILLPPLLKPDYVCTRNLSHFHPSNSPPPFVKPSWYPGPER